VSGTGWDIIPATGIEVAFSSIMILTGTVLYITILGSVTSIVSNLNQAKSRKMVSTLQHQLLLAFLTVRLVYLFALVFLHPLLLILCESSVVLCVLCMFRPSSMRSLRTCTRPKPPES
jgi:hypothetical protein